MNVRIITLIIGLFLVLTIMLSRSILSELNAIEELLQSMNNVSSVASDTRQSNKLLSEAIAHNVQYAKSDSKLLLGCCVVFSALIGFIIYLLNNKFSRGSPAQLATEACHKGLLFLFLATSVGLLGALFWVGSSYFWSILIAFAAFDAVVWWTIAARKTSQNIE